MKAILDLIARHKAGEPCGLFSVCSAHPLAIEATFLPGRCHDFHRHALVDPERLADIVDAMPGRRAHRSR